ncbi:MAG: ABC transporter substrate-binding protein [Planctomycetes bacterium]|nr:ABC transporter substrate-binding protein [Planctomycetota bacterium]
MGAQRIASLLACGTEILYGLGLGERVVAVSHECDYPPEVLRKPRVTRAHIAADAPSAEIDRQVRAAGQSKTPLYSIDVQLLASLHPDLIVTQAQCEVCAVDLVEVLAAVEANAELGAAQVVALNPTTLEAVFEDIAAVGRAAGGTDAALSYVAGLRRRVDRVRVATEPLADRTRPRVVCIEWIEPLMLAANWMPDLIAAAGGRTDLTHAGARSGYADWAAVRDYDPEVILVAPCGFDLPRTLRECAPLTRLPGWAGLRAVRSGQVFAADGNAYFNRSGPRLVDSLEVLAGLIHPGAFNGEALLLRGLVASVV